MTRTDHWYRPSLPRQGLAGGPLPPSVSRPQSPHCQGKGTPFLLGGHAGLSCSKRGRGKTFPSSWRPQNPQD